MSDNQIFNDLKKKAHAFNLLTYRLTEKFPRSELYGTISQLRRAAISVMLNFLEGHARFKPKVKLNFFEISYGSSKECKYLLFFALEKKWIIKAEYKEAFELADSIGAMLWKMISGLENMIGAE